jgi:hypothetical protein
MGIIALAIALDPEVYIAINAGKCPCSSVRRASDLIQTPQSLVIANICVPAAFAAQVYQRFLGFMGKSVSSSITPNPGKIFHIEEKLSRN